jgi:uncharacterized membrane protein YgcG
MIHRSSRPAHLWWLVALGLPIACQSLIDDTAGSLQPEDGKGPVLQVTVEAGGTSDTGLVWVSAGKGNRIAVRTDGGTFRTLVGESAVSTGCLVLPQDGYLPFEVSAPEGVATVYVGLLHEPGEPIVTTDETALSLQRLCPNAGFIAMRAVVIRPLSAQPSGDGGAGGHGESGAAGSFGGGGSP